MEMLTALTTATAIALAAFAATTTAAISRLNTGLQTTTHTVTMLQRRPQATATDLKPAADARTYTSTNWKTVEP
jgi:hypothetical protein